MHYIYFWVHKDSGKTYTGQTENPPRRRRQHSYELCKGKHANTHLQRAWNRYGEEAFWFAVIAEFGTKAEVDEAERFYIVWFRDIDLCYNHTGGGDGNYNPDSFVREKLRAANLGKKQSEETKQKLRKARAQQVMPDITPEFCASVSIGKKKARREKLLAEGVCKHKKPLAAADRECGELDYPKSSNCRKCRPELFGDWRTGPRPDEVKAKLSIAAKARYADNQVKHGTKWAYEQYGCRCEDCKEAKRQSRTKQEFAVV